MGKKGEAGASRRLFLHFLKFLNLCDVFFASDETVLEVLGCIGKSLLDFCFRHLISSRLM
jgi:hypothetical protein